MSRFFPTLLACFLLLATLPAKDVSGAEKDPADRRRHLDGIRAQLDAGAWEEATQLVATAESQILHNSKPERDDDRNLAALALYRAVAEANRGDQNAAEWSWYIAFNLHKPTAYRDVSAWGKAAEVFAAIEVRDLGRDPKGIKTFHNYPGRPFEEPGIPATRVPQSLSSSHALDQVKSVQVEVYLDPKGIPHAPRVLGTVKVPMLYYSMMVQLFETRWRPAGSEGEPVPMLVTATLSMRGNRW